MGEIAAALALTRERISAAARQCGRDPAGVALLAVGKGHSAAELAAAHGFDF